MHQIPATYNYWLVALSFAVAILTSYTAVDLAARVTANRGFARGAWLTGGAFAMGGGVWCMHYVGMLAFRLPIPVYYHIPTVLLSLLAAVLASVTALYVVSREHMTRVQTVIGSLSMGTGIAAMHYIGMAAMRLNAMHHYNRPLCAVSVVLAVVISFVGLTLIFYLRDENRRLGFSIRVLAEVLGAASPEAFGRSLRIAQFVRHIANKFHLEFRWRLEAAATLSQLGCVTLDAELIQKRFGGAKLSPDDQARFDTHPEIGMQLLAHIPRLEATAWMIGQQLRTEIPTQIANLPSDCIKETVLGAKILRLAVAFDHLRIKFSDAEAINNLSTRRTEFERELVDALAGVRVVGGGMVSRRVSTLKLATGMVLDQDVRNKEGLLLVAKGQEINGAVLGKLENFARAGLIDKEIQALIPM